MKHIIVAFLFFYMHSFLHASNRELFPVHQSDSLYIEKLKDSCKHYARQKRYDSAITYARKILKNAKINNDSSLIANSYFRLAYYHRKIADITKSFEFYNESYAISIKLKDSLNIAKKAANMANLYNSVGDFINAEGIAIEGLRYSKNMPENKANLYNSLAISTARQKLYSDALYYYNKALSNTKDSIFILISINNKSVINIKQNAFDKAINRLSSLLKSEVLHKDPVLLAKIKDNLAFAKSKLNYPEAEKELAEALQLRKEIKDFSGQFASNIHLTQYFMDRKDTFSALNYAKQAYMIADTLRSSTSKTEALSYLIQLEENPKKSANEYYQINDSIIKARQQAKNQFAKIKYETKENREKILKLEHEKARQHLIIQKRKIQNILYSSLGLIVLVASFFLYFYLKTTHRKEKLHEVYKTEKRLSRKIHDELANDVYQVMTSLETQKQISDPALIDKLEDIYERTRNISRDNSSIATGRNYADELKQMLSRYGTNVTNIIINGLHTELWKNVPAYKKIELYRALQELMINMRKHSEASLVAITFRKEAKMIQINYSDNGIGLQKDKALVPNGLLNVENRISAIKGLTTFDKTSEKGLKIQLSFPV